MHGVAHWVCGKGCQQVVAQSRGLQRWRLERDDLQRLWGLPFERHSGDMGVFRPFLVGLAEEMTYLPIVFTSL
jgi:hypothetical protein